LTPSRSQISVTARVVDWYLCTHHRRPSNVGTIATFSDPGQVGHFAVTVEEYERGDAAALFKLLVAVTMFQRRQDAQILRILRSLTRQEVASLTDASHLLRRAAGSRCDALQSNHQLLAWCDLDKHPWTKAGVW